MEFGQSLIGYAEAKIVLLTDAYALYKGGMLTDFIKMHGLGNDFVVFDARKGRKLALSGSQAAAIADRRTGVGCDQLIVLEPSSVADAFMRIYNPDGSESGACGNATRCIADLLHRDGIAAPSMETVAGLLRAEITGDGICIDMGQPGLGWRDVPLAREMDTLFLPLEAPGLKMPAACSMGNPHATFFVADLAALDIPATGPMLEHDPLFPERANIGHAQMLSRSHIRLRVWERGAGLTLACGTGACATLVNAVRRGLAEREAVVELDGGQLRIHWREQDGHVLMTGPAATVFHGRIALESIAG
ncbi:Diaminopimelate epimerase [Granulibacter bethesdensis]|uniref:Diaminopimelate epimerase n=2 Tax=Granulibacter bethesdensis TaxID=364410 RepID=A0AAC9KEJ6_9PROT|nr:Diaminopimelate epimerase [Granulibacter bethesdensis]APH62389.1 Diaminopimelate epimerase [Granulibacter bethesdensis]